MRTILNQYTWWQCQSDSRSHFRAYRPYLVYYTWDSDTNINLWTVMDGVIKDSMSLTGLHHLPWDGLLLFHSWASHSNPTIRICLGQYFLQKPTPMLLSLTKMGWGIFISVLLAPIFVLISSLFSKIAYSLLVSSDNTLLGCNFDRFQWDTLLKHMTFIIHKRCKVQCSF